MPHILLSCVLLLSLLAQAALSWTLPLYRDLNGPQLETDSVITVGWQKAF